MNLRFVEAFIWVAQLKSITRAAEKLSLTQSAVSNRIAALEDDLGVDLIDRRNSRFRLSDAGSRFMEYAQKLLAIQREMRNELCTPEQQPFSLRVGAIESILHSWLIPMVDVLKRSSPLINFELMVETSATLNEQIKRGSLDLVFSALPAQEEGLVNEVLTPLDMVFVGPESLSEKTHMDLKTLLNFDIMTFQRGSHPHVSLINELHSLGVDNKHVHNISSISALALLAGSGFGIATLPKTVAMQLQLSHRVCILETPLSLTPLPLHACYWSSQMNPVLKQVIQEALVFAKTHDPNISPSESPLTMSESLKAN